MPAESEKQRKFMGAELARKRAGKKTKTKMTVKQLRDYSSKKKKKAKRKTKRRAAQGSAGFVRG